MYDPNLRLFVDDEELLERRNLERIIGRPKKLPLPVLTSDQPWESPWVYAWGSVLKNPSTSRLQMWYETAGVGAVPKLIRTCYAESSDGIHWEKPGLGRYELFGCKNTNIVLMAPGPDFSLEHGQGRYLGEGPSLDQFVVHYDGTNVVRDDNEPDPQKRYKLIVCMWKKEDSGGWAHNLLMSPDGVHWNMPPHKVLEGINDGTRLQWDPVRKLWMLAWLSSQIVDTGENVRYLELAESEDLYRWTQVGKPFELDEIDGFGRITQGHFLQPFAYGNQYLGFASMIHSKEGWAQSFLVSSRDGRKWDRLLRSEPFLGVGAEEDFDADSAELAMGEPILMGDTLHMYYCGRSRRMWGPSAATGAIGMARLRRDRFAGLANGGWFNRDCNNNISLQGEVTTKPVKVTGATLYLNARSRGVPAPEAERLLDAQSKQSSAGAPRHLTGAVQVELLDETRRPIPGYTLDQCRPFYGDETRAVMRWQDRPDMKMLLGHRVCVRFIVNMATIYAYGFAD